MSILKCFLAGQIAYVTYNYRERIILRLYIYTHAWCTLPMHPEVCTHTLIHCDMHAHTHTHYRFVGGGWRTCLYLKGSIPEWAGQHLAINGISIISSCCMGINSLHAWVFHLACLHTIVSTRMKDWIQLIALSSILSMWVCQNLIIV